MKKLITVFAVLGMVFALAPAAQADFPTTGEYRILFVTSAQPGAVAQNMTALNAWVTGLAQASGAVDDGGTLGTTWSVLGATSTVNVFANTGMALTGGVETYLADGTLFASDYAQFWSNTVNQPNDTSNFLPDERGGTTTQPVQTGLTTSGDGIDQAPITYVGHALDATSDIVHGGADKGYNSAKFPWFAGADSVGPDTWYGNWGDVSLFAISGVIGGEPPAPTGTLILLK